VALATMLGNYGAVLLACDRGCYRVLLSGLSYSKGATEATAEVLEQLTA
jgi:hypothetical protein